MTPADLHTTLRTLGWTIRGLARMLGRSEGTVGNWTRAGYSVPADVAAWLQRRVDAHTAMMRDDPPPSGQSPNARPSPSPMPAPTHGSAQAGGSGSPPLLNPSAGTVGCQSVASQ